MRFVRLLPLVLLLGLVASGIVAQEENSGEGSLFAMTVPVERIYPHRLGYRVVYIKTDLFPEVAYLPGDWFTGAAGRGEMIEINHPAVPYMTVFYREGEFSHIRLFVHPNRTHTSWGVLRGDTDFTDEFSVDTLSLQF